MGEARRKARVKSRQAAEDARNRPYEARAEALCASLNLSPRPALALDSLGIRRRNRVDLVQLEIVADRKASENASFRSFLAASDRPVPDLHAAIQENVDCAACTACCRVYDIELTGDEIHGLAAALGMPLEQFLNTYVDTRRHWRQIKKEPGEACPFLKENRCIVYRHRPAACRNYPYVDRPQHYASQSLPLLSRASVCPIVFELVEQLKERMGFAAAPSAVT